MHSFRERLSESLWFIPMLCMSAATGAVFLLVEVDRRAGDVKGVFAFTGGPESARSILSTIGSSVLVLTGLVFSITVLALQLTSSQFSPRALRTFMRDRPTQWALGVFLATFLYALLALREVRGEENAGGEFVPGVTVALAVALAVASLVMFVQQIHHVAQSIRAVNIIGRIASEAIAVVDDLFTDDEPSLADDTAAALGLGEDAPRGGYRVVMAPASGVLALVGIDTLVEQAKDHDIVVEIVPGIGEFVPEGGLLLRVHGDWDREDEDLTRAVLLAPERLMRQDPGYGLRQLVDIAERALSPGINDPSTAVQCLDRIHDLLRRMGTRRLPERRQCDEDGRVRVLVGWPSWADLVHLALDEIRHWGANSLQVDRRIRLLVDDLHTAVPVHRRSVLLELPDAALDPVAGGRDGGLAAAADEGSPGAVGHC